jgi:golgi-specific brefeldin A-resistance guanine nucleotide exchange factor 1
VPSNLRSDNAVITRGTKAVSMIYQLTARIPEFISKSHLERNEAWATYWSPVFRTLSTQSVNPRREVRHQALSYLQRCLLSPDLAASSTPSSEDSQRHNTEWVAIFHEVLLPLVLRLLKPEIYTLDPLGMSDTRTQAATMLCKVFLHYLDDLVEGARMSEVWLKVLEVLDRLMNSGQQQSRSGGGGRGGGMVGNDGGLEEQVPESLKNVLLVMAGAGYLVPPRSEEGERSEGEKGEGQDEGDGNERIWEETKRRVERFLPGLFAEVFPPPPPPGERGRGKGKEETHENKGEGDKDGGRTATEIK